MTTTAVSLGRLDASPLGPIWTAVSPRGLVAVSLWPERERFVTLVTRLTGQEPVDAPHRVTAVLSQLSAYLNGELQEFDLPIDWSALTSFQATALQAVTAVPYGRLATYSQIAAAIEKPQAVRAVGRANATNPMPLIIPCHRIVGADGKLHGYSAPGGLETKAWLLRLEGSALL